MQEACRSIATGDTARSQVVGINLPGQPDCAPGEDTGSAYHYVTDFYCHCLHKLGPDGHVIFSTGKYGTGPGQFGNLQGPTGIALDAAGNIYTAATTLDAVYSRFNGPLLKAPTP